MTKPTRYTRQLALIVLCTGLLTPAAAQGQTVAPQRARAEVLHSEAQAEIAANNYASACLKLEEVTRLVPAGIGAKLALALCYDGLGKLASAFSQYSLVEQMVVETEGKTAYLEKAREGIDGLRHRLAKLVIEVPDDVRLIKGLVITCDGVPLEEAQWGKPMPANAGEHEIVVTAPGREPWMGKIEVGADGVRVPFSVKAPSVVPVAKPRVTAPIKAKLPSQLPPPKRRWQGPLGVAMMGVGGATFALSMLFEGLALKRNGESYQNNHCDTKNQCDNIGLELRTQAVCLGHWWTATSVTGVAFLAVGVVALATAPSPRAAQEDARVVETGIRMGLELTPGLVRVKGAW